MADHVNYTWQAPLFARSDVVGYQSHRGKDKYREGVIRRVITHYGQHDEAWHQYVISPFGRMLDDHVGEERVLKILRENTSNDPHDR